MGPPAGSQAVTKQQLGREAQGDHSLLANGTGSSSPESGAQWELSGTSEEGPCTVQLTRKASRSLLSGHALSDAGEQQGSEMLPGKPGRSERRSFFGLRRKGKGSAAEDGAAAGGPPPQAVTSRSKSTGRGSRDSTLEVEPVLPSSKRKSRKGKGSGSKSDSEELGGGSKQSRWWWTGGASKAAELSGVSSLSSASKQSDGTPIAPAPPALPSVAASSGLVLGRTPDGRMAPGADGLDVEAGGEGRFDAASVQPADAQAGSNASGSPDSSADLPAGHVKASGGFRADRGQPWLSQAEPQRLEAAASVRQSSEGARPLSLNTSPFVNQSDSFFSESESEQPSSARSSTGLLMTRRSIPNSSGLLATVPAAQHLQTPSAEADAAPTRAAPPATPEPVPAAAEPDKAADSKKGHRRGRSLSGLIGLKTKPKRSASMLSEAQDATASASDVEPPGTKTPEFPRAPSRPKTPETGRTPQASGALACFGIGSGTSEEEEEPMGVAGLVNLGNTCYINAALQCIRFTPGLAELLGPDLAALSAAAYMPSLPEGIDRSALAQVPAGSLAAAQEDGHAAGTQAGAAAGAAAVPPSPLLTETLQAAAASALSPEWHISGDGEGGLTQEARRLSTIGSVDAEPQHVVATSQPPSAASAGLAGIPRELWRASGEPLRAVKEGASAPDKPYAARPTTLPSSGAATPASDGLAAPPAVLSHAISNLSSFMGGSSAPGSGMASTVNSGAVSPVLPPGQQPGPPEPATDQSLAGRQQQPAQHPEERAQEQGAAAAREAEQQQQQEDAGEGTAARQQPPPAAPVKREPLPKGEMALAFRQLTKEVLASRQGSAVDPKPLVERIPRLPGGQDMCDGAQHDCQEVLRLLMNSLHEDLNRGKLKPPRPNDGDAPAQPESEAAKASRLWTHYLMTDNSPITDLFAGQLQSIVRCHRCNGRFTMYEPFLDLSLPLAKEGRQGLTAWLSGKATSATLQDCMQALFGEEKLEGNEAFSCDVCKQRTEATKSMRVHRLPHVLVLHIKRFKQTLEKVTTTVTFPTKGLKLAQFASEESAASAANTLYDLYAVCNHYGSMLGGHYTAACLASTPAGGEQWYSFNDETVQRVNVLNVVTSSAYMLLYSSIPLGGHK